MRSIRSLHNGATFTGTRRPSRFPLPRQHVFCYASHRAVVVVVEGATVRKFSHGDTTMIFIGILLSIAAIGFFCWLLFTLAVFALPFFAGMTAGTWAYHAGTGWLGTIFVGILAAGLTLGVGQILLGIVRSVWARMLIALAFVAPAAIAGYYATHGIVKHTMPSETWQLVFSVIGAIAVGVTAFVRVAGMAATSPTRQGTARA